jgi:hypothetical protein
VIHEEHSAHESDAGLSVPGLTSKRKNGDKCFLIIIADGRKSDDGNENLIGLLFHSIWPEQYKFNRILFIQNVLIHPNLYTVTSYNENNYCD